MGETEEITNRRSFARAHQTKFVHLDWNPTEQKSRAKIDLLMKV